MSEPAAKREGMDVSLFSRLAAAHPRAVCRLSAQYRMAEPIMRICNALVYGGALSCGAPAVAEAALVVPLPAKLPRARTRTPMWAAAQVWAATAPPFAPLPGAPIKPTPSRTPLATMAAQSLPPPQAAPLPPHAIAPPDGSRVAAWLDVAVAPERRVVLLDTTAMPAPEERNGGGNVYNPKEASLTITLVGAFLAMGVQPSSLAIISPCLPNLST